MASNFYGDYVVKLLIGTRSAKYWLDAFTNICRMQNEALKLDALFLLHSLARLRNMHDLIDHEIHRTSLSEALRESPLTKRAFKRAAKSEVFETINRILRKRDTDELDADQLERLEDEAVELEDVRALLDDIIDGASLETAVRNSAIAIKW